MRKIIACEPFFLEVTMETRLQIKLSAEDRNALQKRAKKELRDVRQQALQLVREGLAKKSQLQEMLLFLPAR